MDEEFESKSEVEKIVDDVKDASITMENYGSYVNKVKSSQQVIFAQLENIIRDFKSLNRKFGEKKEAASTKRAEEEGFVPKDIMELLIEMNETLKDAYSWKTLEVQIFVVMYEKLLTLLGGVSALDVKRDTLKEMKEMETKRNDMFLQTVVSKNKLIEEIVNNKLQAIDEKIINSIRLLQDQSKQVNKALVTAFSQYMSMSSKEKAKLLESLTKNNIALQKSVEEPIGKIETQSTEIDDDDDVIEVDDDPFADDDDDNDEVKEQ